MRAWHGDQIRFGQIECILVDPLGQGISQGNWTQRKEIWIVGAILALVLGLFSEVIFALF